MYLFKICTKANLDFISGVKNCVCGFSCSLRCVVTAGCSHEHRPCCFLQEMWWLLWRPSSPPWCGGALCLPALRVLEGHQGWGQWQWQGVGFCSLFLHSEPRFCFWTEELLHSLGFLQAELGRFHTGSPSTEGELESSASCFLGFQYQIAVLSSYSL